MRLIFAALFCVMVSPSAFAEKLPAPFEIDMKKSGKMFADHSLTERLEIAYNMHKLAITNLDLKGGCFHVYDL